MASYDQTSVAEICQCVLNGLCVRALREMLAQGTETRAIG
jgi:hypothetical protein